MQSNRGQDTGPELVLRRAMHRNGLRFFVGRRPIPAVRRTADVVFPRLKIAVFVDGCFWHSCPIHATRPVRNGEFWAAKLSRTVERDRETDHLLRSAGWTVVRIWEHEPVNEAVARMRSVVQARRAGVEEVASRVTPL